MKDIKSIATGVATGLLAAVIMNPLAGIVIGVFAYYMNKTSDEDKEGK